MATKEELKNAAQLLGRLMATAETGDDYDALEELAEGYAAETDGENLAAQLEILNSIQATARTIIDYRVADARDAGLSWSKIGDALDMSKQAAQQRFGHAG